MTLALAMSSGWPVSKVCSARADSYSTILQGPSVLCQSMYEGLASLSNVHLGASVKRYGVHNPFLLVQWCWVFGVYQHVAEGAHWTRDHLDVQLYEDPSHCLQETIDVGQG